MRRFSSSNVRLNGALALQFNGRNLAPLLFVQPCLESSWNPSSRTEICCSGDRVGCSRFCRRHACRYRINPEPFNKARWLLIHRDRYGPRRNSVRDYFQGTAAGLRCRRNIEVRRNSGPASCNSHCTVSMGPGVEDMARCVVGDPDQRIVGSRF